MLSAAVGAPDGYPDWPQFENRNVALTQSARTAIALLSAAAGLKPGDEVLMSAYNCGTELDALLASGLRLRFVDCDERGCLTAESLARGIGPDVRGLYIIHPFGWPQPLDEIDAWRRAHGLVLFEDCALALFSSHADGTPIGQTGDASVFSFQKTLPTPDGGAMTWSTGWAGPGAMESAPVRATLHGIGARGKAWMRRSFRRAHGLDPTGDAMLPAAGADVDTVGDLPAHYYFEEWRRNRRCSQFTRSLISRWSPDHIRERRRSNYLRLAKQLGSARSLLLYPELPNGVCPLHCPMRVNERDRMVTHLRRADIDISSWWSGGHSAVDWSRYPNARSLKKSILPLPIHHQLGDGDMDRLAEIVLRLL
jgi:dTDP-4-amino-4,6-dideoxygalactose transaminase